MSSRACSVAAFVISATLALTISAEQLPVHIYSSADGLAHDHVSKIRRDSKGFLWFCTDEGLSRWDGYEFTSYTTADGLPHAHVDDFLETHSGEYWIATDGGLVRFRPEEPLTPFKTYVPGVSRLSRSVNVLLEDRDGTILAGTDDGLYRIEPGRPGIRISRDTIKLPSTQRDGALVNALLLTQDSSLWVGTGSGLYRRDPGGRWDRFCKKNGFSEDFVNQIREDRRRRVWVGTRGGGLIEIMPGAQPGEATKIHVFTKADGLPDNDVRDCMMSRYGHLWIGTRRGLAEGVLVADSEPRFRAVRVVHATEQSVYWLIENAGGDLWLATNQAGAIRLSREHMRTYAQEDGFVPHEVNDIFLNASPRGPCVINGDNTARFIQCLDDQRFRATPIRGLPQLAYGYEWHQFASISESGPWWFASEQGVLRISKTLRVGDTPFVKPHSILPGTQDVRHVFEDSEHLLWLAEERATASIVATWNPTTGDLKTLWSSSFTSAKRRTTPSCFLEDASKQVWIGLTGEGGLLRWRHNHFDFFGPADGVPSGEITTIFSDRAGLVWIASSEGGLAQASNVTADHPHIRIFSRASGLSSSEVWCITEDSVGRIYAGTGKGVDRVDPATGYVIRYTPGDGLVAGPVRACGHDRSGDLWFATSRGISRLTPEGEWAHALPRILITDFRGGGTESRISRLGSPRVGPIKLGPLENQISVGFLGMDDRLRGDLLYQYRLLGTETDWSKLIGERRVTFGSLPPRPYRFEVRALDVFGGMSAPAIAEFTISPHLWQRWWFRSLGLSMLLALLYFLHHYRTQRALELERVRLRIAADLHDDIGSGLSQIAVLSEVARRYATQHETDLNSALSRIGSVSRELVESMSDIVWSINPQRDSLSDLLQRMRLFGSEILTGRGIEFCFHAVVPEHALHLDTNLRREMYLMFKEILNNVVRHSACSQVDVTIVIQNRWLEVCVEDDGRGLDEKADGRGLGFSSIAQRARRIGGQISFAAGTHSGLRITLRAPVRALRARGQLPT